MKKYKKLIGLLLGVCVALGSVGCGSKDDVSGSTETGSSVVSNETETSTEVVEEKPYKGMEFTVSGITTTSYFDESGKFTASPATLNAVLYAALDEWAKENECTVKFVAANGSDALMAATVAGKAPDLILTNNVFPNYANLGLVQPIDEYVDELGELFGQQFLDMMEYKGQCYGMVYPWTNIYGLKYNRTKMEEMGIKTPKEYYLEGNWTMETFAQVIKECTTDTDADGVMDTIGSSWRTFSRTIYPTTKMNEDGTIYSTLNDQKSRDWYQMLYELYSAKCLTDDTTRVSAPGLLKDGKTYQILSYSIFSPDWPEGILAENKDGDLIEAAPIPVHTKGDQLEVLSHNLVAVIPSGAQNLEASVDMMKYALSAGMEMRSHMSMGTLEWNGGGLKGSTEITKYLLDNYETTAKTLMAKAVELPEWDADYQKKLIEMRSTSKLTLEMNFSGVTANVNGGSPYSKLYQLPSATSAAECYPVHQATCDTYNNKFIYN